MTGVWELSIIEFPDAYLVRGVILSNPLSPIAPDSSRLKSARYVLKTYRRRPLANEEILINKTIPVKTGRHGEFELMMDKSEAAEDLQIFYKDEALPGLQQYPVLFRENDADLAVVSDIDETILQSFTSNAYKRITTTLFKSVSKRKAIDFTRSLYAFLEKRNARFFYVSKSESNLFQIISGFISRKGLPLGAIFLTDYLRYKGLLRNKKEKDFKLNQIDWIIRQLPEKKFILVGDDSQKDPRIYTTLAVRYKEQIKAVYIRRTGKKIGKPLSRDPQFIDNTKVPLFTFKYNEPFSELFVTI